MFHYSTSYIIAIILLLFSYSASSQIGNPVINNFPPLDYQSENYIASPQNWGVIQDESGLMYFGNQSGILTFDGDNWEQVKNTDGLRLYKFAKSPDGRIWSGGLEDLGYVGADSTGSAIWISIKNQLPEAFHDFNIIYNVQTVGDAVFFLSRKWLFCYKNGTFTIVESKSKFERIFACNDKLIVREFERPISEFSYNKLVPLKVDRRADSLDIRGIVFQAERGYLAFTYGQGIYRIKTDSVFRVNPKLDSISIFNICTLSNGRIAAGTNGRGLYVFDRNGQTLKIIDEDNGLQQNQVVWPYVDREGALWTALFSGVSRIKYPNQTSWIDKTNNLSGIVLTMIEFGSSLYLGTTNGCYQLALNPTKKTKTKLKHSRGIDEEVWNMLLINDELYVVAQKGLYRRKSDDSFEQIGDEIGWESGCQSSIDPSRIYVTRGGEVSSYYVQGRKVVYEGLCANLSHDAFYLNQDDNGVLWASNMELSSIRFFPDGKTIVTKIDSTRGWREEMELIEVAILQGKAIFGTSLGPFKYSEKKKSLVQSEKFTGPSFSQNQIAYNIKETKNGNLWITQNESTRLFLGSTEWKNSLPVLSSLVFSEAWKIYEDGSENSWISTTEGVVRVDFKESKNFKLPFTTRISKVETLRDSLLFGGFGKNQEKQKLPYNSNELIFTYSANFFEAREKLEYRFILVGKDDEWSQWTKETVKEYTNLWEGDYTFKVIAKNIFGVESEIAEYQFQILPPWYRTLWAYISYTLTGLFFIFILLRVNTLRLKKQKRRLEEIVIQRTQEVASKVEELEEANVQLLELSEFKEGMTQMIAHDLKNPLNRILNVDNLDSSKDKLDSLKDAGQQMLNLVMNMLDVSKFENSDTVIRPSSISPSALVERAIEQIRYLSTQKHLNITFKNNAQHNVIADHTMIVRVLVNLLTNAIKYSEANGEIEIRTNDSSHSTIRFTVTDQGKGIKSEDLPNVFEKFVQVGTRSSLYSQSTGLGLAFCKLAVEAHDGSIGVRSQENEGSKFWFTLPIQKQGKVSSQETNKPLNIGSLLPILTEDEIEFLLPFAHELKGIKAHRSTVIRNILKTIPNSEQKGVADWIDAVEKCSYLNNSQYYQSLVELVFNDH